MSLRSVRYFSVNTGTEPNLPKPNFLGTDFSKEPIGTCFRGTKFTEEPKYRTDRFGNTECPGLRSYSSQGNFEHLRGGLMAAHQPGEVFYHADLWL
jgi:hypothetical protein